MLSNHLKQTVPLFLHAIHRQLAQKDTNYHFSWLKKYCRILDMIQCMFKLAPKPCTYLSKKNVGLQSELLLSELSVPCVLFDIVQ